MQISHLALIPELTASEIERTSLASYRYAAKVVSNLFVYMCMWAFLRAQSSDVDEAIGSNTATIFRNLAFICVGVGGISCLVFHYVVRLDSRPKPGVIEMSPSEKMLRYQKRGVNSSDTRSMGLNSSDIPSMLSLSRVISSYIFVSVLAPGVETIREFGTSVALMTLSDWLRKAHFWKVFVHYIFAMLFLSLSQAYITLYVEVTLQLRPTNVAIVPLVMFLAGLCTSPLIKTLTRIVGIRGALCMSCLVGLGGAVWVWFGGYANDNYTSMEIYIVAILFGSAGSAMVITGVASISNLIGEHVESSALVFGLMGVGNRISIAIAFGVIQELVPDGLEALRDYYRNILVFVCGASAMILILVVLTMAKTKHVKSTSELKGFYSSQLLDRSRRL